MRLRWRQRVRLQGCWLPLLQWPWQRLRHLSPRQRATLQMTWLSRLAVARQTTPETVCWSRSHLGKKPQRILRLPGRVRLEQREEL